MSKSRIVVVSAVLAVFSLGAVALANEVISESGVRRHTVTVQPNPSTGRTTEQENIVERITKDNQAGALKHFYVIAPKSGQVVLYSTVQGKVTSGGKRLTPRTTIDKYDCGKDCTYYEGQRVLIGGEEHIVTDLMQDDGTYGSSAPYFYWFDANGRYHQHFFTEGQIIMVSEQPLAGRRVMFNADVHAPAK
jgi:hypothetical protein